MRSLRFALIIGVADPKHFAIAKYITSLLWHITRSSVHHSSSGEYHWCVASLRSLRFAPYRAFSPTNFGKAKWKKTIIFTAQKSQANPFSRLAFPLADRFYSPLTGQAIYPSTYICQKFQITTLFCKIFWNIFMFVGVHNLNKIHLCFLTTKAVRINASPTSFATQLIDYIITFYYMCRKARTIFIMILWMLNA